MFTLSLRLFLILFALVLAGCASKPVKISEPDIVTQPSAPQKQVHKKVAKPKPKPKPLIGLALVNSLLAPKLVDRSAWAEDVFAAFRVINIPVSKENVCAVLAEIGQESSFQVEPVVYGLKTIIRRELDAGRKKYLIPQWIMEHSLEVKSPDGRSYNERIAALKTESDVDRFFEDMISEIPFGEKLFADYNPVRTGGPMQVSWSFAHAYVEKRPYPYPIKRSLRNELFSRKGGLFFGVAYLLDYPASYTNMLFRFADFNSGIYSSRNAAFQDAVSFLSGTRLVTDGDLLRYRNGVAQETPSLTMRALLSISARLNMDQTEIFSDLLLEKKPAFEQSRLFKKIFTIASTLPRELIPNIELRGPKLSRKLTTAMYVEQVVRRYDKCLKK
ncbi:MAG: DUF1615 domain-containing protein [Gallionellaceae bacterium]